MKNKNMEKVAKLIDIEIEQPFILLKNGKVFNGIIYKLTEKGMTHYSDNVEIDCFLADLISGKYEATRVTIESLVQK